ncbi:MAG TPA: amidohydrolase family protein [Bryobacteraceae bacterium]|nr:amidohydrolase family protein [Bryobacteraceae bacterium]
MKALLILLLPLGLFAADDSFLLRGATVHTMNGTEIENGSVLVRGGKIAGVGKNLAAPKDTKVIDGKGLHVYPGMIDAATEVGLVEVNSLRETNDTTEIGRFNPQLVALTAVNPSSEHIPVTRANGITTVATMPQGPLISGQVSLIHLDGWTTEEMGVSRTAALHLRMPFVQVGGRGGPEREPPGSGASSPDTFTGARQTFEKQMAELNEFFESARRYKQAKEAHAAEFKVDLKLEAMIPVLDQKEPILVTAIREREIRDALAFADKQKVKIILCEAPEAYKVTKEIKAHNVPVILGPTLELPLDEDDPYDRTYTTPADLQKAGVRFAIGTFAGTANLSSRNLPYQAAQAVAFGLPHDEALRAITKNAAEIWGIGDRLGTIEEGKWADLMVTDGDPLEAKTQVRLLFIKGKPVDLDNRQKQLYEKYRNRP